MTTALKARPTTYNGIEMRSRLEARVAAWLNDIVGCNWEYEPRAFAGSRGQYLPDFSLDGIADPRGVRLRWYLEVKGELPEGDRMDALRRRMTVIRENDPYAGLLMSSPQWMEMGIFWETTGDALMLMSCPQHRGNLFFGLLYGAGLPTATFAGRCEIECRGYALRPDDRPEDDARIVLPEYGS